MGLVESFSLEDDLPPLEPPALETRMGPVPDARPSTPQASSHNNVLLTMKNALLLLLLALLAVPACKKADPVPNGFMGARFGMTREEVKQAVPSAVEHADYLALTSVEYAGLPARVAFTFRGSNLKRTDRLQYIFVEFTKKGGGFDQYQETKARLTKEFGKPVRESSDMLARRTIWGGYEGGNAVSLEQSGPLGDGSFTLVLAPSENLLAMMTAAEAENASTE